MVGLVMKCHACEAEIDENDPEGLGWIRHQIATRELEEISGAPALMHTKVQTLVWNCSLDCELSFLAELHGAAGGVADDLAQIDKLWTPGKVI